MSKCRIAAGELFVKDLSVASQPYLSLGNAQCEIAIEETTQELPDYTSISGANACAVRDVSKVTMAITMYDFDKKNLALALFGDASAPVGGSIVAEAVNAFADGALNILAHMPTANVVVKNGATTYVEGTDYTVRAGGFQVIVGSALETAINAGAGTPKNLAVTVDYDYAAEDQVLALTQAGKTFAVRVEAKNKAAGGKAEVWDFYTVQMGPAQNIALITREFGSFAVNAEVISDETKGVGESKFFKIQQAQ